MIQSFAQEAKRKRVLNWKVLMRRNEKEINRQGSTSARSKLKSSMHGGMTEYRISGPLLLPRLTASLWRRWSSKLLVKLLAYLFISFRALDCFLRGDALVDGIPHSFKNCSFARFGSSRRCPRTSWHSSCLPPSTLFLSDSILKE